MPQGMRFPAGLISSLARLGSNLRVQGSRGTELPCRATVTPATRGFDPCLSRDNTRIAQRSPFPGRRAFLRAPRLLVCDEATSALDSATEAAILGSLQQLAQGRTSIFVAHRCLPRVDSFICVGQEKTCFIIKKNFIKEVHQNTIFISSLPRCLTAAQHFSVLLNKDLCPPVSIPCRTPPWPQAVHHPRL